jgi:hypothetical protein
MKSTVFHPEYEVPGSPEAEVMLAKRSAAQRISKDWTLHIGT